MIPYFHIYADGDWQQPTAEFINALGPIETYLRVGIVGSPANMLKVKRWLQGEINFTIVAYSSEGWEQTTLEFLRAEAETTDEPFLYAHTKGACNVSDTNTAWRRSMLRNVIKSWRQLLDKLPQYAIIGERWLRSHPSGVGFFAGNFWIASAHHLRSLPDLSYKDRYEAEIWIGRREAPHLDVNPGWPAPHNMRG